MDDLIGKRVRVVSVEGVGKIIGYAGDMILVRFADGYTEKFFPHELLFEED